ncbi:phage head closure protein [Teredinibacter turnerae]|uniref:phage head closure protein n=1 Tax=Teredinibacter turnerae TaxID=2426 RepID=UPI0030CF659B
MFEVGELDKQVRIKRKVRTKDGAGGYTNTEKLICKTWAKIRPLSGGEKTQFVQTEAHLKYFIVIRYRNDIDESCWIEWAGQTIAITNVRERGPRDLYLVMDGEKGLPK